MKKNVVINNESKCINVIRKGEVDTFLSDNDKEMDKRAVEAVNLAIKKAKVCNKPIAKYDRKKNKAYIETSNGERKYV